MLCAKLFDIGAVVQEKKVFFYFVNVFSLFVIISPWKTGIPFTQVCFVPSLVNIGPVVLEKKMKM